ncbi:hypothetical protein GALMADRAFT_263529 [Galerina marginata CBS 339.88]|uniref:ATP-binding cassette transporter n=1 Tax=Galerina marginata (strain CBS 339.88) TaxID=685588 RepID=A0A067TIZ4_GALM3|nr:hypothetical protein GALMADRAFT_263529 [Galerina marginata CBS 339.88]
MDRLFVSQIEEVEQFFGPESSVWKDIRTLPLAFAGFVLCFQVVHALVNRSRIREKPSNGHDANPIISATEGNEGISRTRRGFLATLKEFVHDCGGYTIFGFMVARLASTTALLCLAILTPVRDCKETLRWLTWALPTYCHEYSMTITFAYATVLALFSFQTRPSNWNTRYHNVVLLSALGVYAYRDILPLATYNLEPVDKAEGNIIWAKIALLSVSAVLIPLFIPYAYIPLDPKDPMPVPNPEQTASWISSLTYTYIDPLIRLANKVAHLRHDQLPPLADYDYARYQTISAFPLIDPFSGAKRRHLFFGLLSYFRSDYVIIAFTLTLAGIFSFAAPIGINQTLIYLETRDSNSSIKPWVWISLMLFGDLGKSIIQQWQLVIQMRVRVLLQALLTQLVFNHSLRIRLKAETDSSTATESQPSTPAGLDDEHTNTLDDASVGADSEFGHTSRDEEATQGSTVVGTSREASSSSSQNTVKGKSKPAENDQRSVPPTKKGSGDAENLIGRINNLVSSDMEALIEGSDFMAFVLSVPLQIALSMVFLYRILGWSAIVGLITTVTLSPLGGYIGNMVQDVQVVKMKLTDARVQTISEAVGVLRMIKLFGWERKTTDRLKVRREEELRWLWKVKALKLATTLVGTWIPTFTMLVTFVTYTAIMKQELTASKIFSSIAVFSILRDQLHRISWQYALLIEAKVSLDRVYGFLQHSELLDRFMKADEPPHILDLLEDEGNHDANLDLGFRNATFAWSVEENDGSLTPSSRKFRLHIDGQLLFKRNCINLITGPTGSGKTSILMALLGEMHFMPSNADSWFNLPRHGGVAYAAQESWVQNATIRDNILFGSAYDEERYNEVIRQCALLHDLELFVAGDKTEVGERGLTLSGGQKARVTLARAIYSSAEIILLDDVLAALDVHTSAWIIDQCFRGDLVKGRTILLVTHNVALAAPVTDYIISIDLDGSIQARGNEIIMDLKDDADLALEVEHHKEIMEESKKSEAAPANVSDGKLVVAEEIVQGHVTWRSMKLLLVGLGGKHPLFFVCVWFLGMLMSDVGRTLETWFLGVWGSQYETQTPYEVNLTFYISVFSCLLLARMMVYAGNNFYLNYRSVGASRVIHEQLVESVFGSTLRWLDETPTARIIARCTQDIRIVDGPITQSLMWVLDMAVGMLSKLGVIVLFSPVFVFPGIAVAVLGIFVGNLYLRTQLSIKREMSNARSPLLAHFSAAIHGLVSIRAYGAQTAFRDESLKRIDFYSRTARTSWDVNRWIGLRMDALGVVFSSALAFYLVYSKKASAANTGFLLNMAINFCSYIFWLIRIFNELEVESNSLERIQGYIDIEHEPKPTQSGQPPAAWPSSGDIRVENLSARYSKSGPEVLHGLNFHVTSGQRVGIVGRTGSGKSSLTLALLRCILTEGTVYFDGIATNTINLDALRTNITIIPQTPELLSGTLRQNLDPFEQNDDATLNDALRAAGLFSLQEDAGEARLSLDSKISGGGGNLSVGQRQIIALARAMVRGSKLLILDEATSAIDYKTDAVIQSTLRSQLGANVTVITVAHRLQTIMDSDKILVLENGHIVEFDSPRVLLANEKGALRALVEGSGDKSLLYALAGGGE